MQNVEMADAKMEFLAENQHILCGDLNPFKR